MDKRANQRPTRNELKDVALLGLSYSMLNYADESATWINDELTKRINAIKGKVKDVLGYYYKSESQRIARLIDTLDTRTKNISARFSITAEQVGLNLISLNLPHNERARKRLTKDNVVVRELRPLAPILEKFWVDNKDEIWYLLEHANSNGYEKYAVDSENLAYIYIEQMRDL